MSNKKRESWRISYYHMMDRCFNPNGAKYWAYGARGITVCDEWKSNPKQFYADMGDRPEGTSLDRIDGAGNYSKENCRWATYSEQAKNRYNAKVFIYNGQKMTLEEAALASGIPSGTLQDRRHKGAQGEALFARKNDCQRKVSRIAHPNGDISIVYKMREFCNIYGLHTGAMSMMLRGLIPHHKGFTGQYVEIA